MKTGKTLEALVNEVERQASAKADYIARAPSLKMAGNRLAIGNTAEVGINDNAHDQISAYTEIPSQYYSRLRVGFPGLLADNVNTLLAARPTEKRMIRTLDGNARAFLSDRFRPLDNVDLMENLLPTLFDRPDLRFASAEITDRRLYLKVISSELEGEVKRGDVVRMGLVISNSEVGAGAIAVSPFTERLVCTNGMVHSDLGQRRNHIGRATVGEGDSFEMFTDETRSADDRLFFLKIRDTVKAILDGRVLEKVLDQMREGAGEMITGDPVRLIEAVSVKHNLNEKEKGSVLRNLIAGADLSRWGLSNAVTRCAQDADSYDRASELEQAGGALLAAPLPPEAEIVRAVARRRARTPQNVN